MTMPPVPSPTPQMFPAAPPAPARARRALPPDATTGGLAFHRLVFARRRSGWWTPLVTGLVAAVFWIVLLVVAMIGLVIWVIADPQVGNHIAALGLDPASLDMTDPVVVTIALGTLVLMLPAYLLASLLINGRRTGLISSVAGRLRWRWMLVCAGVALAVALVLTALTMVLPGDGTATGSGPAPLWWVTLLIVIALVPFQAAAEEYIFRGYFMQAIGRWLRHPAFAILLPVPLFVLGHAYDPLGQTSVGLFAVAAGWLTWRTGGLEAAIALHVVNNLLAFGMGLLEGSDPTGAETGIMSFLWSALLIGVYVALIEVLQRRWRLSRTLVLTAPRPSPVFPGYVTR